MKSLPKSQVLCFTEYKENTLWLDPGVESDKS